MELNRAVDLYGEIAAAQSVKCGSFKKKTGEKNVICSAVWSQRDVIANRNSNFSISYVISNGDLFKSHPSEINDEQWNVTSKSGKFKAIMRKIKGDKSLEFKQYLEIWNEERKIKNIEIESLDMHGVIYDDDSVFGCFKWSPSETKLLYIAEEKQAKTRSYFKQGLTLESEVLGDSFVYKEKWGEQMTDKRKSVLCVLDVQSSAVSIIDWLPSNMSYGQATWAANDHTIYLIGWYNDPYRLGIIYCPIRKNILIKLDLGAKTYAEIGPKERAISFPVVSPMGDKMAYLDCRSGGPHMQCSRLSVQDVESGEWKVVVDVVACPSRDEFPGLYCSWPHKFWSADNKRIVLSSHWRSKQEILVVNTDNLSVKRLTNDSEVGSWKILDMDEFDNILATRSSVNRSDELVLGKLPGVGREEEMSWRVMSGSRYEGEMKWSIVPVQVQDDFVNKKYPSLDYEYILVEPLDGNNKLPMLVFNHGGPHAAVTAGFNHLIASYCLSGMMVLLVNYRGSIGFGQDNIESLLGNIGTQDVFDVKNVVDHLMEGRSLDRSKLVVTGGSHGGFLTCHLIGQFPDLFKVAVARNPVFNLMTLLGTSDIPDWVYTEMGLNFEPNQHMTSDMCLQLHSRSPIAHISKVKAPMLLLLGAKDLRVPPSQGLQCFEILKSRSVPTRALMYPDSNHPLSEVEVESDGFMNSIKWINTHLLSS